MRFLDSSAVEQVVFELKLADWPRGCNRALVNDLANGMPPYSDEEVKDNNLAVNTNFLTATELTHDARRQFSQAFLVPDPLIIVTTDAGPQWKRQGYGQIITK